MIICRNICHDGPLVGLCRVNHICKEKKKHVKIDPNRSNINNCQVQSNCINLTGLRAIVTQILQNFLSRQSLRIVF